MNAKKKSPKLSNHEKARQRVEAALEAGRLLKGYDALAHAKLYVGPYRQAVDNGIRFAVIAWGWRADGGGRAQYEFKTAAEAAEQFTGRVGSTRAREAAIAAEARS